MPLLLGTKGNEILQWRASAELVATLKASLARKWGRSSALEAQCFLGSFIGSLDDELSYEAQFLRESAALDQAIDAADSAGELQQLRARYRELVSAYFRRRQSALALCGACSALHDRLAARALSLAGERMLQAGLGEAPLHALLVSGDRGRREETLHSENRYFLLYQDGAAHLSPFGAQLAATLKEVGLASGEQTLWHGSFGEWRALLKRSFAQGEAGDQERVPPSLSPLAPFASPSRQGPQELPEWEWHLEAMADLCLVQGDPSLASQALNAAALTVQAVRRRGPFLQLARRVIGLPLALGLFGRWRLQREGEHRLELNLEEMALGPLVMTVRVLAAHAGVPGNATADRIQGLLEKGALDVELAERLLKAYQCFMQLKILSEIRSEGSGAFCDPEQFDEAEDARVRSALEAVLSLQKIAYQRMVGQG